jgi:thymidylate synthase (FAD)
LEFYLPKEFRTQHKSNRQASNEKELIDPVIIHDWSDHGHGITASQIATIQTQRSLDVYRDLLANGICREQARMILPQNLYTEYYGTTNLNNLLKFIDLRTHMGAQWEIQKAAQACFEIAMELFPVTVSSYRDLRGGG